MDILPREVDIERRYKGTARHGRNKLQEPWNIVGERRAGNVNNLDRSPLIPRDTALQSIRVVGVTEETLFRPSQFDHLLSKSGLSQDLSLRRPT